MTEKIRADLPGCPQDSVPGIASLAAYRTGKRIGRTAKESDLEKAGLRKVVFSWIRLHHTDYDKLRMQGKEREAACEAVRDEADSVFREWQGSFESPDAP